MITLYWAGHANDSGLAVLQYGKRFKNRFPSLRIVGAI
jgi:hypothetical protein